MSKIQRKYSEDGLTAAFDEFQRQCNISRIVGILVMIMFIVISFLRAISVAQLFAGIVCSIVLGIVAKSFLFERALDGIQSLKIDSFGLVPLSGVSVE